MLSGRREFADRASVVINSIFPSLVVQQIVNTLATRHVRPRSSGEFDLYWTYFGYADDPPELVALRMKQANLVGPAGFISMEDGEAIELIQRAIERGEAGESFVEFGGLKPPRPARQSGRDQHPRLLDALRAPDGRQPWLTATSTGRSARWNTAMRGS